MNDIEQMQQNHPELIVRDLRPHISEILIRNVLKRRGVNKWFRVRRLIIQLKNRWKKQITNLQEKQRIARQQRDWVAYHRTAGQIDMLTDCRQQVRALCHSSRDVDFPHHIEWGSICDLPHNFPDRPNKRWLRDREQK